MRKKIFTTAAIALALGFASCSQEQGIINHGKDNGKATSMKVSISFPRATQTRATDDINATDNEAKISWVDVFIYTANGNFSSRSHLTSSDFSQAGATTNSDIYESSTKIQTTTGAKNVFVAINLPPHIATALEGQPMGTLYTATQTMTSSELAGANFVMFSTEAATPTFKEDENDPANKVAVKCQRLVAKVTVETDASLVVAGAPGQLDNLKFAINNFNTKLFLMQGAADEHKDPNWTLSSYQSADFEVAVGADYVPVLSRALIVSPTIGQYEPRYAAENTSEQKLKKEITRATIRATFIPQEIMELTSGAFTVNNNHGVSTPQTFYAVIPSIEEGASYFFDEAAANAFLAQKGGEKRTYVNGYCYWDIFLNKNPLKAVNRWDVLRNDFYKCNITRIVVPGRPTAELPDPDVTPDVDTQITIDIEILFWNTPILSNYDI
ncbi:MAG: Mfa1 family fimbria major subunit [Bacteroidales bacterium]|nr:Mfa1 family fimbria major subunit [Bacteroidales bacterium]